MKFVERYSKKYVISPGTASSEIKNVIETIKEAIKEDGKVQISGLGTFKLVTRPARTARNPRTGETISVPEKEVVKFTASKSFKDQL